MSSFNPNSRKLSGVREEDKQSLLEYFNSTEAESLFVNKTTIRITPTTLNYLLVQRGGLNSILHILKTFVKEGKQFNTMAELIGIVGQTGRNSITFPPSQVVSSILKNKNTKILEEQEEEEEEKKEKEVLLYTYDDGTSWFREDLDSRQYGIEHLSQINWDKFLETHPTHTFQYDLRGSMFIQWNINNICLFTFSTVGHVVLANWVGELPLAPSKEEYFKQVCFQPLLSFLV